MGYGEHVRADAARNRATILDHARRLIADRGVEVTMDEIAAASGLAVGTLYRHHPTKADLVGAVVDESVRRIADRAAQAVEAIERGADPGEQLDALFRAVAERSRADRAVKQAAAALGARLPDVDTAISDDVDTPARHAVLAVERVLTAAQAAGVVRGDITVADLLVVIEAVPPTADAAALERYLDIVLSGIRRAS